MNKAQSPVKMQRNPGSANKGTCQAIRDKYPVQVCKRFGAVTDVLSGMEYPEG